MCIQISETPFLWLQNYVSMCLNKKTGQRNYTLSSQLIKRRPKLNSYKTK